MPWILALIGFTFGMARGNLFDALVGTALGYLLAIVREQGQRLWALERGARVLDEPAIPTLEAEPAAAPPPETEPRVEPPPAVPPPRPEPPTPPATGVEDPLSALTDRLTAFLTGASLMVTLGVVVLFFGVAFLLKYAVDHGMISIELRLLAAAASGVAMLVAGTRSDETRPSFGRALQGGGIGVLYLTVFAAYRLYGLLSGGLAFSLLVAVVGLSSWIAVVRSSRALAILGTVGGFLAPILASTGQGSHVALFSYYLVLNAGILAIAWFRSWRSLNLTGFVFTFVLSGAWALRYYTPEYFGTTEPFLVAFFLMYVAIAVAYAVRRDSGRFGAVDGTLVFGVPLVTATFQAGLVHDERYGLAWSALALGVFYVGLAATLVRAYGSRMRALCEAFLGEGVVFLTLAVPFAFEGLVTSAFWALEGAAIVWVGVRQDRPIARLFGFALQGAAGIAFLADPGGHGVTPFANAHLLGAALIAVAAFASSRHLSLGGSVERALGGLLYLYGLVWWLGGGLHEIETFVEGSAETVCALLSFFALTAASAVAVGRALDWRPLERISLGFLPALAVTLTWAALTLSHPFAGIAVWGWLSALVVYYLVLRLREDDESALAPYGHAGGFVLVTLLLAWESAHRVGEAFDGTAWAFAAWGLVPAACLLTLLLGGRTLRWPVASRWTDYQTLASAPVAAYLGLWTIVSVGSSGDLAPLGYVPIASPVDVAAAAALVAILTWRLRCTEWFREGSESSSAILAATAGLGFLALHGVVLRTVHHATGVPFTSQALLASEVVQTGFAALWAITGLGAMVLGTRRGIRSLWSVGAALMGAVVLKLFVVDLSHTGTVARIVSFLGVGLVLLAVGYLSPVPPRAARTDGPDVALE